MANKYLPNFDMAAQVIDMDTVAPLVRQLVQDRILESPVLDAQKLDTTFFDNSAVDFGLFDRRLGFGQEIQFIFRDDVKPLDNFESKDLKYKEDITCGGQLDLDCTIPCGGTTPTFRNGKFRLSRQYAAMAQVCRVTERFITEVEFMDRFRKSLEAAKLGYSLDVWNKLVSDGLATTAKTLDARIAAMAGVTATTHAWDASTVTPDKWIPLLNLAHNYMTRTFKGNFAVFATSEFASEIDKAVLRSGIASATNQTINGIELGTDYNGMYRQKTLPSVLSNVNLNIIPDHADYSKDGVNHHPLYNATGTEMYVVIASRDSFVHHTVENGEYITKGDCNSQDGIIDKITHVFYAGFQTVYPEKVLVIKLKRPELTLEAFDFCCN